MRNHWMVGLIAALWLEGASAAALKTAVFDVEHMTCPACSVTIAKALDKVPGVNSRHIDTPTATVTVTFDPERTTLPAVAHAMTQAGFPANARTTGG